MDYDANLKREILSAIQDDNSYLKAMIINIGKIEVVNESKYLHISHTIYQIAWDISRALKKLYRKADVEMTFEEPHGNRKSRGYVIIVDPRTTAQIIKDYDLIEQDGLRPKSYKDNLSDEAKIIGFLQGIFLSRGRVFLPVDDTKATYYQLEIVLQCQAMRKYVKGLFDSLNVAIKEGERRNYYILYIKDSEVISDYIALMGASEAVIELQSLIVVRDVRNNTNRAVNCNVANISKSINAASEQIEAIKMIDSKQGLNSLDDKLKELAYARLNNPEATLSDLAVMLSDNVSKSGINHRMRKLMQLAYDNKEDNNE